MGRANMTDPCTAVGRRGPHEPLRELAYPLLPDAIENYAGTATLIEQAGPFVSGQARDDDIESVATGSRDGPPR